jgi:hypothetical protein
LAPQVGSGGLAELITFNLAIGFVAVFAGIWLATMEVPNSPTAHHPRAVKGHVSIGSFASSLACPRHVRLGDNLGNAGFHWSAVAKSLSA